MSQSRIGVNATAAGRDELHETALPAAVPETPLCALDVASGHSTHVIGLFGKWGYGKTSVLNFVKYVLTHNYAGRIVVFPFNPWLFKDADAVLHEFFSGLTDSIGADIGKPGGKLGLALKRYGTVLRAVTYLGTAAAGLAGNFGEELLADTTQEARNRVVNELNSTAKKVVVLIDDLARCHG